MKITKKRKNGDEVLFWS